MRSMAAVEDLCRTITEQLKSYDQQKTESHRLLQAENSSLRARLATITPVNELSGTTPRLDVAQDKLDVLPNLRLLGSSWVFTSADSTRRFAPARLGASTTGTRDTPRLQISQLEAINNSHDDSLELPMLTGEQDDSLQLHARTEKKRLSTSSLFSFSSFNECSSPQLEGPLMKWRKIMSTVMNMSLMGVERQKIESALLLRPAWDTSKYDTVKQKRHSVSSWLTNDSAQSMLVASAQDGSLGVRTSANSKFILHPDSRVATIWSLLGAFMILYDVLTFPLAGFDLEESDFATAVMLITTIFWTTDIMLTFLRGVHYKGVIELRPSRICWLYARSWLVLDLLMVTVDWFVLYMTSGGDTSIAGESKVLRSGKALRAARVVRAVRLIRTIKVFQYLREVFENIKSEHYQLLIKLMGSVAAILVLSHYVTCSWFAQAHFNIGRTWITVFLGDDPRPSFAEEYFTSMHFSLTQLAGSQNIVPQNSQERFIASVIIVFDIVIFSTLVGLITDIMSQFRSLTFDRSNEVNLIRKFFARIAIPPLLESRIWHFFRRHYRSKNRNVNECEIEFFKYLPSSLKMDLHSHLYIPVLATHPLFNLVLQHDRYSLLAVCVSALTTASWVPEAELFSEGDLARMTFFVTGGLMHYNAKQFDTVEMVSEGRCIAEATLWTKWMHCGRLTANTNCEALKLEADMFEKTMLERADTSTWFRGLRKYAALFAQRVSDSFDTDRPITDVDRFGDGMLEHIVNKSFSYLATPSFEEEAIPETPENGLKPKSFFTPFTSTLKRAKSSLSKMHLAPQRSGSFAEDLPVDRRA